ncbi:MAG: aminopeptidase, partial [Acutalibacteraceae bacterium]|nr:aminopeptidase [Acutalibacteraceae bacterium]
MSEEKTEVQLLQEKLMMNKKHAAKVIDDAEMAKAMDFAEGYKKFLNDNKTEREVAAFIIEKAKKRGFVEFDKFGTYKPGDKVYYLNRKKAVILAVIGKKSIAEGAHIAAAHIDSPRVDLKPNPLYESSEIALMKTHYYGGIR